MILYAFLISLCLLCCIPWAIKVTRPVWWTLMCVILYPLCLAYEWAKAVEKSNPYAMTQEEIDRAKRF